MDICIEGTIDNTSSRHSLLIQRSYWSDLEDSQNEHDSGYFHVNGKAQSRGKSTDGIEKEFLTFLSQADASIGIHRCSEKYSAASCRLWIGEDKEAKSIEIVLDLKRKDFDDLATLVASGARGLDVDFSIGKETLPFVLSKIRDATQWDEHQWNGRIAEFRVGIKYFETEEWQRS